MEVVPICIKSRLEDFNEYLKNNDRSIFSARFGDGKSYFLSKFIDEYENEYLFIPIYPVNYQVSDNKDIFEYIKRDILIRLIMSKGVMVDDTVLNKSVLLWNYFQNNKLDIVGDLLGFIPQMNILGFDIDLKKLKDLIIEIKTKFDTHNQQYISEEKLTEKFITDFDNIKGSIYEFDVVSQLICDIIDRFKQDHPQKQVVLIIEDLDRIDPAHIFRILNILSAHFDRPNIGLKELEKTIGYNKFKLDKILTVCHYENIKSIYHHFYGGKTDFNGYINKFSTARPFHYSLKNELKKHILNHLDKNLLRYTKVCDVLCSMIINKYSDDKDGVWGNLRLIDSNLKQKELIKEESIEIGDALKISTVNNLTKLLSILLRFDLQWYNLENYHNRIAKVELNNIIGECWLYAKVLDDKFEYYLENDNAFSIEYKTLHWQVSVPFSNENNVITIPDIMQSLDREKGNDMKEIFERQKDNILKFFNSYLISSSEKTVMNNSLVKWP